MNNEEGCYFCKPNEIFNTRRLCSRCLKFHKEEIWSGKAELYTAHCCILQPGFNYGAFWCAGGPGYVIKNEVKKWIEERGGEYNADNVLCALYNMEKLK